MGKRAKRTGAVQGGDKVNASIGEGSDNLDVLVDCMTNVDERTCFLWVHMNTEDATGLHHEVESDITQKGVDVAIALSSLGFWDTPFRMQALELALAGAIASIVDAGTGFALVQKLFCNPESAHAVSDRELRVGGTTSTRYLQQLRHAVQRARRAAAAWTWLDRDKTSIVTATTEMVARRAIGAVLEAARKVVASTPSNKARAFVLTRPPGHHNGCDERIEKLDRHAWRYAAHGGCIFNETAVVIRNLYSQKGSSSPRIAVLDLDAHFGDGTAWHFYEDANVLCISLHLDQSDLHVFPYLKGKPQERGSGHGAGYTMNLPLLETMGGAEGMELLQHFAFPAIIEHQTDLLFVSLGFDGMSGDPAEANLNYTKSFFEHAIARCCDVCPRIVCTLQGGYLPEKMAEAIAGVLHVLAGMPPSQPLDVPIPEGFGAYVEAVELALNDTRQWWTIEQSFNYIPEGFEQAQSGNASRDCNSDLSS